ncbi:HPP family protein [Timonella sp. A28]|uniref:HPP family protein n=1 Tax=Timonella sp. A28 TaxID=3442640 RepID=UPI003EB97AAF
MLKNLMERKQPAVAKRNVALAGLGGALAILALAGVTHWLQVPLLAATFGASCVLVFTLPESPLSQPINVVGGHVVSALCGLIVAALLPGQWWSVAVGVGVAISVMAALRVTHPPAGANPIVIITAAEAWSYLIVPIALGAIVVVVIGAIFHTGAGRQYPLGVALPVGRKRKELIYGTS